MISADIIGISSNLIYSSGDNLTFFSSPLSAFLLEIYLSELDWYVSQISGFFSFKKLFDFNNYSKEAISDYDFVLNSYLPIKIKYFLKDNFNLKSIHSSKNLYFKKYYLSKISQFFIFNKNVNYLRYIDHFLIGFIGSKVFSLFFYNKILNFIRGTLHFDFDNPFFYSANDKFIFFLGFNIRLTPFFKNSSFDRSLNKKKYLFRIYYKIQFYKRKISNEFANRLNLELVSHFKNITFNKVFNSIDNGKKIWTYIFQLEAVRSSRYGKILLSSDKLSIFSHGIFMKIRFNSILNYRKYLFSLYIFKSQSSLQKVIRDFPFNQTSLSFPFVRQLII